MSAYRKRNKAEREAWESGQTSLDLSSYEEEGETLRRGYELFEAAPDDTPGEVREKETRYHAVERSDALAHRRLVADAWCAAFVWPKTKDVSTGRAPAPITHETFQRLKGNAGVAGRGMVAETQRLAGDYGFFHWHVAFPNVFGEGVKEPGFDVVLGNPPWEHTELKEQEWFAARSPEIAAAPGAKRKRMIEALKDNDPTLYTAFKADLRLADGSSHYVRNSDRFPLCGKGRINTYAIFAETKRDIISATGRVGCIVPSGIATDNTTKDFFADLVATQTLASLYDFENKGIFPNVHSSYKFSLLTLTGARRPARAAEFAFFCHAVSDLRDPERRFPLSVEDIRLLNPNTRTCPIFRTRRDAEITKEIYRRVPVLIDEDKKDSNPWGITFKQGLFNMTSDSGLFRTRDELEADGWELEGNVFHRNGKRYLPLYEAKMLHHYDHRWATYTPASATRDLILSEKANPDTVAMPRYWVPEGEVQERMRNRWNYQWLLGWRDIARSTDERTMVAGAGPLAGYGHKFMLALPNASPKLTAGLASNFDSFVFDYVSRQKIGSTSMALFVVRQLPVLPPDAHVAYAPWSTDTMLRDWIAPRVLELTYTAWDLEPFARDIGYDGPPFRWDPERRSLLRCELNAAFFHLYGIGRDDADYIMETFPIVKRKDEAAHGEYRTKRVILEIYDQMAATIPKAATETTPEPETPPAIVTRLHPRPRDERPGERRADQAPAKPAKPRPQETPSMPLAAEGRFRYAPPARRHPQPEDQTDNVTQSPPAEETSSPNGVKQPQTPRDPVDDPAGIPSPEAPNPYDAALALNACVPDGQKVPKDALLQDAARELGHPRLTRKVKTALNKALNTEHNAGRLKTNWQLVWKPRKK